MGPVVHLMQPLFLLLELELRLKVRYAKIELKVIFDYE